MTPCRSCSTPIFASTHAQCCSQCWGRVVSGELTLNMGPETRQQVRERFVAHIPEIVRFDRIVEAHDRVLELGRTR